MVGWSHASHAREWAIIVRIRLERLHRWIKFVHRLTVFGILLVNWTWLFIIANSIRHWIYKIFGHAVFTSPTIDLLSIELPTHMSLRSFVVLRHWLYDIVNTFFKGLVIFVLDFLWVLSWAYNCGWGRLHGRLKRFRWFYRYIYSLHLTRFNIVSVPLESNEYYRQVI